jgi:hypothetical protein
MTFPKLPPYTVPEQDADLLDCGATITNEMLAQRGFLPCLKCGEMIQPGWGTCPGFCSKPCQTFFSTEAFRTSVREATGIPSPLHWIEKGMIEIALERRFAQLGRLDVRIGVDPRQGFLVTPKSGGLFVGARAATIGYDKKEPEDERNLLNLFLLDTVVPSTGYHKQLPKKLPTEASTEDLACWVWQMRFVEGLTYGSIGKKIGRSRERVRQILQRAECDGRKQALGFMPTVIKSARVALPVPVPRTRVVPPPPAPTCPELGHGTKCALPPNHEGWHRNDRDFEWDGEQWRDKMWRSARNEV